MKRFCGNYQNTSLSFNFFYYLQMKLRITQQVIYTAKLSFCGDLKHFRWKWLETSHSLKKCDCFRLNLIITQKVIFSQKVWKRENPEKILIWWKQLFFVKPMKRDKYSKKQTFFLLKIRHIQLNYTFLVLWSIFAEIDWKLLFLGQKRDYLGKKLRNTHDLIETTFFVKPVKWDKYWRKCFSSSKWATYS